MVAPPAPRFAAEPAPPPDFVHPAREQQLAELAPRLAERIDTFYAAQKPPSLAVAVVADGQVVLSRVLGMADVAAKTPADARTLYRIGSVTKTFTAALVLALRDDGHLELVRGNSGACKLAAGATDGLSGDGKQGAVLPIDCERGGPKNLVLDLDAQGKVTSIFFRPREDGDAGRTRCTAPAR